MKKECTPFARALRESGLKPLQYCRAVTALSGQAYSPVMASRWISGLHEAPAPAVALAVLLGRVPEDERLALIQGPPRKKYTRNKNAKLD